MYSVHTKYACTIIHMRTHKYIEWEHLQEPFYFLTQIWKINQLFYINYSLFKKTHPPTASLSILYFIQIFYSYYSAFTIQCCLVLEAPLKGLNNYNCNRFSNLHSSHHHQGHGVHIGSNQDLYHLFFYYSFTLLF